MELAFESWKSIFKSFFVYDCFFCSKQFIKFFRINFCRFFRSFFYQEFYQLVFLFPETRSHIHWWVLILCSQIFLRLFYLNNPFLFHIFLYKWNIIHWKDLQLCLNLFFFRSFFSFVCGVTFLNLVNLLWNSFNFLSIESNGNSSKSLIKDLDLVGWLSP